MKVTIYPRIPNNGDIKTNPYINDFTNALEQARIKISNQPNKNPLFSLLFQKTDSDAYLFHWLENVPDYKYGLLQTICAIYFLFNIKRKHKKIVWFLHNKQPHLTKHKFLKKLLITNLLHKADLIITHASEGIEVVRQQYPPAVSRTLFLHHPTKDRVEEKATPAIFSTDLLIWGTISPYKGVPEFVRFAAKKQLKQRIKVIGKCNSDDLLEELTQYTNEYITIENKSISFDELRQEIQTSRFVLIPYASESILSSGILMDSLSFGARIIGPNVGSFRDYAKEPKLNVYTFDTYNDILTIMQKANEMVSIDNYRSFLRANNWEKFGELFYSHLQQIINR